MKKITKILKKVPLFIKKHWLIVFLILLLGAGGVVFISNRNKPKPKETYTVKRQTIKETTTFSGEIDADEKVTLRFQTPGKLAWVGVKEGDIVNKFQGIASLDQGELKKELKQELNTFAKSRLDLDQQQSDTRPVVIGALSKDKQESLLRTAQKAQYDVDNAVLDVELKDIALKLSFLSTPIAGVVTRITSPYPGVNIAVKDAEFDIVNPKTIFFSASADQTEVVKIGENAIGEITLDSYPSEEISGTVSSIAFVPDEDETGTVYKVKLTLDPALTSASKLRLGMTGDATFTLKAREDVIAVPTTFIQHENGKPFVYKRINNKPEKVFVTVGDEIDIATIVTSGLAPGDVVYD